MNARTKRCRCRITLGREIAKALDSVADLLDDRYGSSDDDAGPAWAEATTCGGQKGAWARDFLRAYAVGDSSEENTAFDAGYVFGLMEAARAIGGCRR